jgi:hypothetical protein
VGICGCDSGAKSSSALRREVLSAPIHSSPIWSPNRSFKELGSFLPTSISDAALGHRVEVQDTNTPSHVLARQKTSQRGLP